MPQPSFEMEESRSVTPWVNRLYFESPHASSFLGLRLVKARHKNLVPLFSGVKPDPMVGSGRYAEPIPVKSPLPQCDSDCSPCRPLVPEWNNTKRYVMQTWLWIMNIFFCNSHIDAIKLGLACFTTLIGSLVNTATPGKRRREFGAWNSLREFWLAAIHITQTARERV